MTADEIFLERGPVIVAGKVRTRYHCYVLGHIIYSRRLGMRGKPATEIVRSSDV